jgi:hypothetical protein
MGMRMYRIELSPGEETAFRSIEELAVAIRRGIVTTHARIWHNASNKWLPIQFHPHFKLASSMQLTQADLVAGAPVKPLELLTLGEMVDVAAPPRAPAPEPKRAKEPMRAREPVRPREPVRAKEPIRAPDPIRAPEPVRSKERDNGTPPEDPKPRKKRAPKTPRGPRSGRPLKIALAGALAIGGAHLAFTAAMAALSKNVALESITHRRLIPASMNDTLDRPETTTAGVLSIPAVARNDTRRTLARPIPSGSAIDDRTVVSRYSAGQPAPEPAPRSASLSAELPMAAAPDIQPAPSVADIALPGAADSLSVKLEDSSAKKTMKGILRAIGGPVPGERKPTKH